MTYKGEKQATPFLCVFASVSAAVSSVCGKEIWTQHTLFDKWKKQGIEQVHFGNIYPVAMEPVQDCVKAHHYCDNASPISNDDYLKMIKKCLDAGGVVIVSLQVADLDLNRKTAWHMLSLIRRDGDNFTAWDTAPGHELTVTANQLITNVPYGSCVLALHDEHDMLLVQPI
jgi:hypothetical protein